MKTREELETEYDATITLWSDSCERMSSQPIRENNVVADSLESAEMMLLCGLEKTCCSLADMSKYQPCGGEQIKP